MRSNQKQAEPVSYELILQEASRQKGRVFSLSKTYPAFIVLVLAIAISFLMQYLASLYVANDNQNAFDKAVNSVMNRLDLKYQENLQIIKSMQGLYKTRNNNIAYQVFDLYGSVPANAYESIISICYVPKVEDKDLGEFIYLAYAQVWGFKIIPPGKRDVYYPIYYIVPFNKTNEYRSGFDFGTSPDVLQAMLKARDSNRIMASPVMNLRPDTLGFYLVAPTYYDDSTGKPLDNFRRKQFFNGVLLLEIDVGYFFKEALATKAPTDSTIAFKCVSEDKGYRRDVYLTENASLMKEDYEHIAETRTFDIADRTFYVEFKTIPKFAGAFKEILPWLALIISLLLGLVLFFLVLSISTSRARALDLAERMTRSQRRIVESSQDIIAVLSFDGVWRSMNPASEAIFGLKPSELIDSNIEKLFFDDSEKERFFKIVQTSAEEVTERIDIKMLNNKPELVWVNWSLTLSNTDKNIYCIGRDVTLARLAEEQAKIRSKQILLAEQYAREGSESKSLFMTKLSHQLRNALTSILGYLQLLSNGIYEDQEEHDSFVALAEENSEELFTYVSDMVEVALADKEGSFESMRNVLLADTVYDAKNNMMSQVEDGRELEVTFLEGKDTQAIADKKHLTEALQLIFTALTETKEKSVLQINAVENKYEGALEIQVLSEGNSLVAEMIDVYKKESSNLIEAIKNDKNDIILNFARASSSFKMLNGSMTVDTFGAQDGNLVQISMPLTKTT